MAPPEAVPPCIVLGLETQIALSVVRELGRAGVPVIGIAQSRHAIGLGSRYLFKRVVLEQPRSEAMLECIRQLGEEFGEICLLTVSEVNLNWLLQNQTQLGKVRAVLPTKESLSLVLDKQKTLSLARSVGIDVPRTIEPQSIDDVAGAARSFSFPVVLKWKDPNGIAPLLSAHGIEMKKAEYAGTAEELLRIGQRYASMGSWPLIQEYCHGVGLGQFFYMHKGEAIRRFQHVRIAEWPPEGGFSSVCDSVSLHEHRELQERSIALLQAIGWKGVAMVEYRYDPTTGRTVLMEINGRFWGSFPLAVQCGAGFALLAYLIQIGDNRPQLPPVKGNLRCRMVVTEVKRLVRLVFQPSRIRDPYFQILPFSEIGRFLFDFFRPNVRYFVWESDDPVPFFVDVQNAIFRR